jgi:hypothetical protein
VSAGEASSVSSFDVRLASLLDEHDLLAVVNRYLRGCERQDWDMVLSCFEPGAPADYGLVGRGTIEDVVAVLRKQMTLLREFFFLGTHTSQIVGRTATSTTSAITVHHPFNGRDAGRNGIWGLRYQDRWSKDDDDRWRIAERVCEFDWHGSIRVEEPGGWKDEPSRQQ